MRPIARLLSTIAAGALLAGCTGTTTGATAVDHTSATLNASGTCEYRCTAFFRIRLGSNGGWRYTRPFTVTFDNGTKQASAFHAKVSGMRSSTDYEYQVCGAELTRPLRVASGHQLTEDGSVVVTYETIRLTIPFPRATCVGPDGTPGSVDRFSTRQGSVTTGLVRNVTTEPPMPIDA